MCSVRVISYSIGQYNGQCVPCNFPLLLKSLAFEIEFKIACFYSCLIIVSYNDFIVAGGSFELNSDESVEL